MSTSFRHQSVCSSFPALVVASKPYSFFWQSVSFDSMSLCVYVFSKIFDDEKYSIKMDDDLMLLVIDDSEVTDSAIYRCEAANNVDTVSTQCKVVVDQRPDEPRTSSSLSITHTLTFIVFQCIWHQRRTLSL